MTLVIDGVAFPVQARSSASHPDDRAAEDLAFGARDTLEDLRAGRIPSQFQERGITTWQGWMMFCTPHVARHFNVDEHALLEAWVSHYALGLFNQQQDAGGKIT